MSSDEWVFAIMGIGGWITFMLVLVFLPSTHRSEKKHGKRARWNPREY